MAVQPRLEAVSDFVASTFNLSGDPAVALPPSSTDPAVGQMRVYVYEARRTRTVQVIRHYDATS